MKKKPSKKNKPKKEKGVADLTNPENKYVLLKVVELTPDQLVNDEYRRKICEQARLEYRKGLNK